MGAGIRLIVRVADLPPVHFFSGPVEVPDAIDDLEPDEFACGQGGASPDALPVKEVR